MDSTILFRYVTNALGVDHILADYHNRDRTCSVLTHQCIHFFDRRQIARKLSAGKINQRGIMRQRFPNSTEKREVRQEVPSLRIAVPVRRMLGRGSPFELLTRVPLPERLSIIPSARSSEYARTTVLRLTPNNSASFRSDGSKLSGGNSP